MNSTTHITCPGCNKSYSRPAVSEPRNVRCKQCGTSFVVAPLEDVPVANVIDLPNETPEQPQSLFPPQPVAPSESLFPSEVMAGHQPQTESYPSPSSPYSQVYEQPTKANTANDGKIVWVIGALLTLVFVFALIVAGAIWYWFSISKKPAVAKRPKPAPTTPTIERPRTNVPNRINQPREPLGLNPRSPNTGRPIIPEANRPSLPDPPPMQVPSVPKTEKIETKVSEPRSLPKNVLASFGDMGWGIKSMEFTPDNRFLVCGHQDRKVSVYDLEGKRRVQIIEDLRELGQVLTIAISPDGSRVLTGGYSGRIIVWSIDENGQLERVGEFPGHTVEIKSMAIDPTGTYVISGDRDKAARLWNLETCREICMSRDFDYYVMGTGFTDGGKTAVACSWKDIVFFDVESGEVVREEKKFRNRVAHAVAFSPDGNQFAVSEGYKIEIYETDSLEMLGEMKAESSINWTLKYANDGKHVLSGQSAISIWNVDELSLVGNIDVGEHLNVQTVAISKDGKFISGIGARAGETLQVYKSPIDAVDSTE